MDVPQPPPGGAGPLLASERRTTPRYLYRRKTLCQPCPHSLFSHASTAFPACSPDRDTDLAESAAPPGAASEADNIWLMGTSQDLSAGGIGFLLHRRFDLDTLLTIELQRPRREFRHSEPPVATWGRLSARVLHAIPQPDGHWRLGCAWVKALSEEELQSWFNDQHASVAPPR